MATIEQLLGHSADELAAMTDEQILDKFRDCFNLEPTGIPEPVQLASADKPKLPKAPKQPKKKLTVMEQMMAELDALNSLTKEIQ